MKKILLSFVAMITLIAVAFADNYLDALSKAEKWIDANYKIGSITNRAAKKKLTRIIEAENISDNEKISKIKEEFPNAFKGEEKPLIYMPSVSWKIHSLALGYDIQERATKTIRTVDIYKDISSEKVLHESTERQNAQITNRIAGNVSVHNETAVFNPLSWVSSLLKTKVQLSGSISYGENITNDASELWSKSQQETFAKESSYIEEKIAQTDIKDFHLTFTITVTNNGYEDIECNLRDAYIPVYGKRSYNKNAVPHEMPETLTIPPHRKKDIIFRMKLDTTTVRELAVYMQHNAPKIDILEGGNLPIKTKSGKDVLAEILEKPQTAAVNFNFPEFSGKWNIRRTHTPDEKKVTIKDALYAINKDFERTISKYDLLTWKNDELTEISSVAFGKFAANDNTCRYMAFLQIDNNGYGKLDANILNKPIPDKGFTIWIIDLNNLEAYRSIHPTIKDLIYKSSEKQAKSNAIACYHLAEMYRIGFHVEKNQDLRVKYLKIAAEQGNAKAQNSLGNCYYDGKGVEKDKAEAVKWVRKAAEQGNAVAQFNLGLCYKNGEGVEINYAEAVKWYRKAAEQEDASAQYNLGLCYKNGEGVEKNYDEAVKWYRKAAEQGNAKAQNALGYCYDNGEGVEKNNEEAVKWYRKAAEQGNAKAQNNLGICHYSGEGVEKNYDEAVKWFRKAAEQGYAQAQYNLGLCYIHGVGVEKNYAEAVKWFRKAAEQGDAKAQNNLGNCYYNGKGVEKNYDEAVKWFRKAVEQGNTVAQNNLGDCYYYGKGVEKNYAEAVKWYRKAAEQGNTVAQNDLGDCYYYGKGVEKNYAEAVKWYRKAAEQGNTVAQNNLGDCYHYGKGVKRNYVEAVKWFQKAAKQGDASAQYNLGCCHYNGKGVERNYAEAVKWFQKAAEQGYEPAQKRLK